MDVHDEKGEEEVETEKVVENESLVIDAADFVMHPEEHEHADGERGEKRQRRQHPQSAPHSRADDRLQLPHRMRFPKPGADGLGDDADEVDEGPVEDVPLASVPDEDVGEAAEDGLGGGVEHQTEAV